jgi:hypothetical protein
MESPVGSQTSSRSGHQNWWRFFGGITFEPGALVATALLFAALILPVYAFGGPPTAVTVLVYNYTQASPSTLAAAEREATRILGAAGAAVVWVNCWDKRQLGAELIELCTKGWTSQTPGLRLIPGTNKFLYGELGEASIPVYATIYHENLVRKAKEDDATSELPILMGCVIAHELGHLLLGNPHHSTAGIMQANWGASQFQQALRGRLLFTKEQARMIRGQVLTAANR